MSSRFIFPVKKWIDSMDRENLKHNINKLEYENYQHEKWLYSSILTSNTYPIKQTMMRNYLLITMMKTRLEELYD